MKKYFLTTVSIVAFFLCLSTALPQEVKQDEWQVFSEKEGYAGTIKKERDRFIFYDKDEIALKETSKGIWQMYNQENEFLGTINKEKSKGEDFFKLYDKNNNYLGAVLRNKDFRPSGAGKEVIPVDGLHKIVKFRTVKIKPQAIKLYIYVLRALETINQ